MKLNLKKYSFFLGTHAGKKVIWIKFVNEISLEDKLKAEFNKVKWNKYHKAWILPYSKKLEDLLSPKPFAKSSYENLSSKNMQELIDYQKFMKKRGLSPNSIKTYNAELFQYFYILGENSAAKQKADFVNNYLDEISEEIPPSRLNSRINAMKLYYEDLKGNKNFIGFIRPKKETDKSSLLKSQEFNKTLKIINKQNHRLMFYLCFKKNMTITQITALKKDNIAFGKKTIITFKVNNYIKPEIELEKEWADELKSYIKTFKPSKYLFEGKTENPISRRAVQSAFKRFFEQAQLEKRIGVYGK